MTDYEPKNIFITGGAGECHVDCWLLAAGCVVTIGCWVQQRCRKTEKNQVWILSWRTRWKGRLLSLSKNEHDPSFCLFREMRIRCNDCLRLSKTTTTMGNSISRMDALSACLPDATGSLIKTVSSHTAACTPEQSQSQPQPQ